MNTAGRQMSSFGSLGLLGSASWKREASCCSMIDATSSLVRLRSDSMRCRLCWVNITRRSMNCTRG
jgi:hypothetical protein